MNLYRRLMMSDAKGAKQRKQRKLKQQQQQQRQRVPPLTPPKPIITVLLDERSNKLMPIMKSEGKMSIGAVDADQQLGMPMAAKAIQLKRDQDDGPILDTGISRKEFCRQLNSLMQRNLGITVEDTMLSSRLPSKRICCCEKRC